ncbi:MAG: hypothetical protein KDK54_12265 [Leptospiraceae bacterium]|nr:hypothetical protein [Leptospiraceae bacterium]
MKSNLKKLGLALSFLILLSNCTKDLENTNRTVLPVLSTLFNNRMLLLLKGTYASDNPLEYSELNNGTGQLYVDASGDYLDPAMDTVGLPSVENLPIYIDFGELRIASKYQPVGLEAISSVADSTKFWDFIATERQVYCIPVYSIFENTCTTQSGFLRMTEFFNGTGAQYPSNDPTADARGYIGSQYYHAGVYIRSMVTGFAKENGALLYNTRFDNNDVFGSNIVPRNSYKPGATDADKQTYTPLMFPIFYTVGEGHKDMTIRPGYDPYIIEMRINIKENLMVHSWVNYNGYIQTMVGLSDWRFDHAGQVDMGGNVLLRSRVIYPEYASSLTITGGTRSLVHYYALYREEETDFVNQLPLASTPVKSSTNTIKYIHSGNYRLRCITDANPVDGYPETFVRETTFSVSEDFRQQISVDLTCP